ncbi:MAG: GNAT family N-acetyltransferase [Oscillospiraceae bacterium]|nr:GNAT family N-acetyltransferase [Oscillospiraceae bacterium]
MNPHIRKACRQDICRLAEIEIFNYRLNFYPIFRSDFYYFDELQVSHFMERYEKDPALLDSIYVYDDGVVKAMVSVNEQTISKLFVEPVLHSQGIGSQLLRHVLEQTDASQLWVLEKNSRAIAFYEGHGFRLTEEKVFEDGTTEYLIKMIR